MPKRAIAAFVVLSAALAVTSVALGGAAAGAAGPTAKSKKCNSSLPSFNVVFLGDLTGANKTIGNAELIGFKSGNAYVNANRGGMAGRCIKLVDAISDNNSPAAATSLLLQYLSSHDKPDEIWPGTTAAEYTATLPVVARNGVFSMSVNDAGDLFQHNASENFPNSFASQVARTASSVSSAATTWLKKRHVKGKVGILQLEYALGPSITKNYQDALAKVGISTVVKTYPPDAVDLTPQVSALKDAGVAAVINVATGASQGYALVARAKLGMTRPWLAHVPGLDLSTLVSSPDQLKGAWALFQRSLILPTTSPAVSTFTRVSKQFGGLTEGMSIAVSGYAWDAQLALAHAAAQANAADVASLTNAMEHLKVTSDPLYLDFAKVGGYTADDHENVAGDISTSFGVARIYPIKNGVLTKLAR